MPPLASLRSHSRPQKPSWASSPAADHRRTEQSPLPKTWPALRSLQAVGSIGNMWDGFRESFDFVSGANDVIVIRHPDGRTVSSPFSVQTNASTVNRHLLGKDVDIYLNGRRTQLKMLINDDGRLVFPQWDNTLTPQASALGQLPLRDGKNSIDFRLENQENTVIASTFLFLWAKHDKIVVVDIDGTITRTDAGGVVASSELGLKMGLGHSHEGVTEAMAAIESAGYRLLFLTARPITRADATRRYLNAIGKDSGVPMPSGALITSALGTFNTMAAVWKDIKSYKVRQLMEVQELFDCPMTGRAHCCYAGGFGNHDYDAASYREAGTPPHRVMLIDEDSIIRIDGTDLMYNGYHGLLPHIPDLFPPVAVLHWQDGAAHSTPPPGSGQLRPPRSFSVNKIPGAALIGEVTSKAWGNVAKATSHGVSGLGHQMDKLPGAGSLKSLRVPDLPKMPSLPGVPFPAGAAAAGVRGGDRPPSYSDPAAHGLIDRGE